MRPDTVSTKRPASISPTSSTPIVRPTRGRRLSQLAEHHHVGDGRQRPGVPRVAWSADGVDERRVEVERQALVAAGVVVRAHVLVAGMADEKRSGDELVRLAAEAIAEAALPHVAHAERVMPLDKRLVARPGFAPVVDHRDRAAVEHCCDWPSRSIPRASDVVSGFSRSAGPPEGEQLYYFSCHDDSLAVL